MAAAISWLEDSVVTYLHLGHSWLDERAQQRAHGVKPEPQAEWEDLYEDNGSCLSIISDLAAARNSHLHIVKRDPLTLSDGHISVEPELTRDCARIAHAPLNSAIAVRKYTLRCTSYGPPQCQFNFVLNQISWAACDCPERHQPKRSLASSKRVQSILAEINKTREKQDRVTFGLQLDPKGSIMSQPSDDGEDTRIDDSYNTQMPFASQANYAYGPPPVADTSRSEGLQQAKPRSKVAGATNPADDLLALLSKKPTAHGGSINAPSTGGFKRKSHNRASQSVNSPTTGQRESLDDTDAHGSSSISPGNKASRSRAGKGNAQNEGDSGRFSTKPDTRAANREKSSKSDFEDEFALRKAMLDDLPDWLPRCQTDPQLSRIPDDQMAILMKPESWFKPDPRYRFPEGNIPINLLIAFKEQFRKDAAAKEAPHNESDEHSDRQSGQDMQMDQAPQSTQEEPVEDVASTSEVSWSQSPTPEPPPRPMRMAQVLPPDSSMEGKKNATEENQRRTEAIVSPGREVSEPPKSPKTTDKAYVQSSPPPVRREDEQDEDMDMEMDVPQALGDDLVEDAMAQSSIQRASNTNPSTVNNEVILVEQTPYGKGKSGEAASSRLLGAAEKQRLHETTEDMPTNSLVRGDNDHHDFSADMKRGNEKAETRTGLPNIPGLDPTAHEQGNRTECSKQDQAEQQMQDPVVSTETNDVTMSDAPSDSCALSNIITRPEIVMKDQNLVDAQLDTNSVPAQILSHSSKLSKENTYSHQNTSDRQKAVTHQADPVDTVPVQATAKRKHSSSPSKRNRRHPKRREIKIMKFSGDSLESGDLATRVRRERQLSLERFRAERSSSATGNDLSNPETISFDRPQYNQGIGPRLAQPLPDLSLHSRVLERSASNHSQNVPAEHRSPQVASVDPSREPTTSTYRSPSKLPLMSKINTVSEDVAASDDPFTGNQQNKSSLSRRSMANHPSESYASVSASKDSPATMTILGQFRTAYPEYTGNSKHFLNQCKQILELDREDKMVPRYMWDDYLIRNRTDYADYSHECIDNGEIPLPWHRYYKDHIRQPIYTKGIIENQETLIEALEQQGSGPSTRPAPALGRIEGKKTSRASLPWDLSQRNDGSPLQTPPSVRNQPRQSLPSMRAPTSTSASPIRPPVRPTSKAPNRSSTPNAARQSLNEALAKERANLARETRLPSEITRSPTQDWSVGHSRMKSWTGDGKIDRNKPWPANLATRRSIADAPKKSIDVLDWKVRL